MRRRESSRKAAFRAALALAEKTQAQWAEEHGVTAFHLSVVLNGERESASLTAKMDEFIAEWQPHVRVAVSA